LAACRRIEVGCWKSKTDKAGAPVYLHQLGGTNWPQAALLPTTGAVPDRAGPDTLHAVYGALLAALPLSAAHRDNLRGRGLPDVEIDSRAYATLPIRGRARIASDLRHRFADAVLRVPGIVAREREGRRYLSIAGAAGLVVPVRDPAGRIVALLVRRDAGGDGPRYSYLSSRNSGGPGPGAPVHFPKGTGSHADLVRVTEGALKADVAHALTGLPTLGLPGIGAWRPVLPLLRALDIRAVRLALDADAADKAAVARALTALAQALSGAGLAVELERWPAPHKGIDDALAAGSAVEVLAGDAACRAIGELTAEGTATEPLPPPGPLDRLADVLAADGPEAVYRDGELLRALAQLAETDPAEFACRRAQLQRAGFRLRDLDGALAPIRRELRAAHPPANVAGAYRVSGGRIVRDVLTKDGIVEVPLANWAGRIAEEVLRDDGAERQLLLAVEGALADGTPLPRAEIAAERFSWMRWPVEVWGTRAVVLAGVTTADHLRCAVQLLSGDVPRRTVYGHAGWRRIGEAWVYLHAGGAVGADGPVAGIEVALPDPLAGLVLPDPPQGEMLTRAVRASLGLLNGLAPDHIMFPLLGAIYRAALGEAPGTLDLSLHLAGPHGTGKSEMAALAQQHYGAGLDRLHLPGTWLSTGNALEGIAFAAKDALLVVDDYAPTGAPGDRQRLEREADRLLRAQGNRSGRQRMRADGSLRPTKPPRGLILSTGEEVPPGQSLRGRMLVLEVSRGDVALRDLTPHQCAAADGLFAQALAGFTCWLAAQYDGRCKSMPEVWASLRDQALAGAAPESPRTPGIIANLALGLNTLLEFARDVGAITDSERKALDQRAWRAILAAAAGHGAHLTAAEPTGLFLRLLAAALASGRAHVAGPDGQEPPSPNAWGWRHETVPGRETWRAQGRRIGWIDGVDLYLEPEASFAEAHELARAQGDGLPVSRWMLVKRLKEKGVLASWDVRRQRNTVRRTLEGVRSREVLHLRTESLSPEQPSEPSTSAARGEETCPLVDGCSGPPHRLPAKPSIAAADWSYREHGEDSVTGRFGQSDTGGEARPGKLASDVPDGPYREGY
jgi:hypothetical protein